MSTAWKRRKRSITGKLARGSFPVSFFLACLTVLGIAALALADL